MSQLENPVRFGMVTHAKNPVLNNRLATPYLSPYSTSSTGPQGDMGPQGPIGERGPTGFLGMRGEEGPQGPQGPSCACFNTTDTSSLDTGAPLPATIVQEDIVTSVESETTLLTFETTKEDSLVYFVVTYYSNSQGDVHLEFWVNDENNNKCTSSYFNTVKKSTGYTTISIPVLLKSKVGDTYSFIVKGKDGYPVKFSYSQVIF